MIGTWRVGGRSRRTKRSDSLRACCATGRASRRGRNRPPLSRGLRGCRTRPATRPSAGCSTASTAASSPALRRRRRRRFAAARGAPRWRFSRRSSTSAGFGPLKVDGIFGPLTQKSVRSFQRANRLVPDGVVGKKTFGKLAIDGGGPAPAPTKCPPTRLTYAESSRSSAPEAPSRRNSSARLTLNNLEGADAATRRLAGSLADAVGEAWSLWQRAATMVGIIVNAVTARAGRSSRPRCRR